MLPTYVATKHTTNELLFDTYVKTNYVLNGMPSVVAFDYQLAMYIVYFSIIISMSSIVICMDMSC